MAMAKRIQVWFPDDLQKQILSRVPTERTGDKQGGLSEAIRESLTRYYALIDYERAQIRDWFTPAELGLILDMSNSTWWQGGMIPLGILANCEDCEPERYEYHEVDRDALLAKLRALNATQEHALVDACERWWRACSSGFEVGADQLLK